MFELNSFFNVKLDEQFNIKLVTLRNTFIFYRYIYNLSTNSDSLYMRMVSSFAHLCSFSFFFYYVKYFCSSLCSKEKDLLASIFQAHS